jgi:Protein of unknown function (DUF3302)
MTRVNALAAARRNRPNPLMSPMPTGPGVLTIVNCQRRDSSSIWPLSIKLQETGMRCTPKGRTLAWPALSLLAFCVAGLTAPSSAHASFLPHEYLAPAATGLAWFIIVVVPIAGIVLFWLVHVMPEKIAHKRHHPQRDAIKTLCLLSLVFGGLLWPIAWLWAFVKPVGYQAAYGTEKHEDYFHETGEKALGGELLQHEIEHLRDELDAMDAKGALSAELKLLRKNLAAAVPAAARAATTATNESV